MPVKQCLNCGEINLYTVENCINCDATLRDVPIITGQNVRPISSTDCNPQVKKVQGIGGWLIVVILALFISFCRIATTLATSYLPLFTSDILKHLSTPGHSYYSSLWIPFITFETLGNIIMWIMCAASLIFIFLKKRFFPRFMIVFYCFNLIFIIMDTIFLNQIKIPVNKEYNQTSQIIGQFISCCIWIPYFVFSKRVKNTFIN